MSPFCDALEVSDQDENGELDDGHLKSKKKRTHIRNIYIHIYVYIYMCMYTGTYI